MFYISYKESRKKIGKVGLRRSINIMYYIQKNNEHDALQPSMVALCSLFF